jgi:uroporphyrin-III C-methyltransferase
LTLEALAAGEAQQWLDPAQPSLLMIGEAFRERASASKSKEKLKALQYAA